MSRTTQADLTSMFLRLHAAWHKLAAPADGDILVLDSYTPDRDTLYCLRLRHPGGGESARLQGRRMGAGEMYRAMNLAACILEEIGMALEEKENP